MTAPQWPKLTVANVHNLAMFCPAAELHNFKKWSFHKNVYFLYFLMHFQPYGENRFLFK